ncbi:hypothetical protein DYD21_20080 [Rhodohalobacter sp. SW132]|nr:hypothetical protein DYD21_20080 [Rhodohalobacter sp. SW132]
MSKQEALEILPLVVDNEATESEKVAFFQYIQQDTEIRKQYESMLFIKQLLKTKYSPDQAPDYLKKKISGMINDLKSDSDEDKNSDIQSGSSPSNVSIPGAKESSKTEDENGKGKINTILKPARYLIAASVIFFFSLVTIELLEKTSSNGLYSVPYDIEEVALSHFNTGSHVSSSIASFQPASIEHASEIIEDEMAHNLRMPTISGAELRSVYYTTFADGFTTPVLEFYQSGIEETVHIFAFRIDDLEKKRNMERDPEAVKLCNTYEDYHVKDIEGKHVVSWKWGDYWYTAVSNHNGNDLIALLEPSNPYWNNDSDGW